MRKLKTLLIAVMSLVAMATTAQTKTAYAVYCEKFETGTLYFLNSSETLTDGGTFTLGGEELTITKLWSGEDVTNSDIVSTEWSTYFQQNFEKCQALKSVVIDESFKDVKPKSFSYWFYTLSNLQSIKGLENLDTSEATSMSTMFNNCRSLTELDLSSFDTGKVEDMTNMFLSCTSLKKLDLSSFNTSNVTKMMSMFNGCEALTELDLRSFDTGKVTNMINMFAYCSNLTYIDKSDKFVTNTDNMYTGCNILLGSTPYVVYNDADRSLHFLCNADADLTAITLGDGTEITLTEGSNCWKGDDVVDNFITDPGWNTLKSNISTVVFDKSFKFTRPTGCYKWFNDFSSLTTITGLDNLYTSKVTDMHYMFRNCSALTALNFGENFTTAAVKDMSYMFSGCRALTALDLSGFTTEKVTDMQHMFFNCMYLNTLTFGEKFTTPEVTSMYNMFSGCYALTELDLSNFTTEKVTNMRLMFSRCSALKTLTFGEKFTTEKVEDMANMFSTCSSLTELDLSRFTTTKVTSMFSMFSECSALKTLTLSEKFTTPALTNMNNMFKGCSSLTELDLSSFTSITNMNFMFQGCSALTSLDIRNFEISDKISTDIAACDKLMKLNMSAAKGDVNLLANNENLNGRGMMISVPDGFDLANVSTENYIVKTTGTSFARAFTVGNMSTICLPYAVDATAIAELGTLYKYAGMNTENNAVKFTAVTGETTPGEAYLFKPATGDKVFFAGTDAMTDLPAEITEGTEAGLYGTYTGKVFGDEAALGIYFGWANGSFWRAGENAEVKHNRAYLKTAAGTTPARLSVKLGDETTGISEVSTTADDDNAPAYDLMGRRVGAGYKGIVIKNGRKIRNYEF